MDIPKKKQKRIASLIKSSKSVTIIIVLGIFIPILWLIGIAAGWLYYFEIAMLLKKYDAELSRRTKKDLKGAQNSFLVLGVAPLIIIVGGVAAFLWYMR